MFNSRDRTRPVATQGHQLVHVLGTLPGIAPTILIALHFAQLRPEVAMYGPYLDGVKPIFVHRLAIKMGRSVRRSSRIYFQYHRFANEYYTYPPVV
jgi:hypothetical protein